MEYALSCGINCGSTHVEGLQKYGLENGLSVGFAYDGDADHCLAVDEKGRIVGGDQSGHIIFGKYATTGDGILTSLMIMMAILDKKMPLSMLCDEMKKYPQCLKNVRVKDKKTAQENPAVLEAVNKVSEQLGNDGRILLRASGTEPKIRVMVEATSDELCEKCVDDVIAVIKAEGLIV